MNRYSFGVVHDLTGKKLNQPHFHFKLTRISMSTKFKEKNKESYENLQKTILDQFITQKNWNHFMLYLIATIHDIGAI